MWLGRSDPRRCFRVPDRFRGALTRALRNVILDRIRARPFESFSLVLRDGRVLPVNKPFQVVLLGTGVSLVYLYRKEERFEIVCLSSIEAVEAGARRLPWAQDVRAVTGARKIQATCDTLRS